MGNSSLKLFATHTICVDFVASFVPNHEYGRDAHWNNFFFFSSSSCCQKTKWQEITDIFHCCLQLDFCDGNFLKLPCYNNNAKIWVSDDWTWTSCVENFLGCCLALGPPNSSSSSACPRHPCHSILATFLILLWCNNSSIRFHQKICLCAVQINLNQCHELQILHNLELKHVIYHVQTHQRAIFLFHSWCHSLHVLLICCRMLGMCCALI